MTAGHTNDRFGTCALSAAELAEQFRAGSLSPVEVADEVLAAIDAVNPQINAFCFVDPEATRQSAKEAEQRYRDGATLGPLDGVPASIKDVFLSKGQPTFRGSTLLAEAEGANDYSKNTADAPATAATKEAGCVIVGKNTTPEFAWKGVTDSVLMGPTRNPYDTNLTPGGSSGGSSAAVAAGLGPLSVGTDAGGSVRIPASFTGTVALKPTYGVVPMFPNSPFGTLAHAGPMTRTVLDASLYMDALIRPDGRDWSGMPPSATSPSRDGYETAAREGMSGDKPLAGVRIAYSPDLGFVRNDPEVERDVASAVRLLEELGAQVEQPDLGLTDPVDAFHVLWFAGAEAVLRPYAPGGDVTALFERIDPSLADALQRYNGFTAQDFLDATAVRMSLGNKMGALHDSYDLLVTPTMPIPPFEIGSDVPPNWHSPDWTSWTPYTYLFNMTQQPALSIPCGATSAGLPTGIQIVAKRFDDRAVMRAGAALEQALGNVVPRPRVHACSTGGA